MEFTITQRDDKVKATTFERNLSSLVRQTLRNVWEFADRRPEGVYLFIDFTNKAVDTLVRLSDGKIYSPLELHLLQGQGFDPLPSRRESFINFLQRDVQELEAIWGIHKKLLPRRVWAGVFDGLEKEKLVLEYLPVASSQGEGDDVAAAVQRFRSELSSGSWHGSYFSF